ncbi:MAG: toprim domain-containing protein [Candidatus Woesearchaeota archaeon]
MNKKLQQELLREINKAKDDLTIVEGIKDKKSLESLGFKRILLVKGPLFLMIENITKLNKKNKKINILTDLDKEGRQIHHILKDELCRRGIKCNDRLREILFKTELRQIEGLKNYLEKEE